ncbi:MAG: signal recognition particle protein [Planctomycetota bacterium]
MFEAITNNFENVFRKLRGKGRLTESNIKEGLHEVRLALLEADVNYRVVKDFIQHVTDRAVGEEVIKSIAPGQQVIKIVHDELVKLMGESDTTIPFKDGEPTLIMLMGLQGSGKTTSAGKLAKLIQSKGKKPLLVAADVQRPAAIEQLKVLGRQIDVPVYFEDHSQAVKICKNALKYAKEQASDVVIFDTAGRLHIDEDLMAELKDIKANIAPHQIYFVCDSMTGQDAVNSAKEFDAQMGFDGVILTKLDGDTRGGAALSIRAVTGKPIKFVGIGEKLDRLEEFHPDRMASRILGMGDIVSLVERAQQAINLEEAEKLSKKISDDSIGLDDFLNQLQQIKKMGPLKEVLGMIPGLGNKMDGLNVDEKQLQRVEAVIRSMTPEERSLPDIINGNRRLRIANGSGTTIQDVNQLLKQFRSMKKMMKVLKGSEKGFKKMGQLAKGFPLGKGMLR